MLWQGEFNYTPYGLLDNTHLRFFTRRTVVELFAAAGYAIDCLDTTTLPILAASELLPAFDRQAIAPELLAQLEGDRDATTFQFIVRARPLDSETRCQHLQAQLNEVQAELLQTRRTLEALQGSRWWQLRDRLRRLLGKRD